jgi:hypothetical protein
MITVGHSQGDDNAAAPRNTYADVVAVQPGDPGRADLPAQPDLRTRSPADQLAQAFKDLEAAVKGYQEELSKLKAQESKNRYKRLPHISV